MPNGAGMSVSVHGSADNVGGRNRPDSLALTDSQKAQAVRLAREDCWRRGCTCSEFVYAAIIGERDWRARVTIGIEHARGCPLWSDRDLSNLPPDAEPDSVSTVELKP